MNNPVSLKALELTVRFDQSVAVDSVSFTAESKSVIGLIGPNGAGKTTLIKALSGIVSATAGTVELDGTPLAKWNRAALARSIGYLSQSRTVNWPVTVERLVSLGRLPYLSAWGELAVDDAAAVDSALHATDVNSLRTRIVQSLSGGELARVLLARVLAGEPRILFADEPVSGLDPGHSLQVLNGLRDIAQQDRLVFLVLHDLTLASRYCDRLLLMNRGRVVADGAPNDVLSHDLLSSIYGVDAVTVSHNGESAVVPWALRV